MGRQRRERRVAIVGAGSAGCVLAARLSELSHCRVTLVEAGPDLRAEGAPEALRGRDALAAAALADRTWPDLSVVRTAGGDPSPYLVGRGVGGSSAVNGMLATLGPRATYDEWAAAGCDGWSAADLTTASSRIALPCAVPGSDELGSVDAALVSALPGAHPTAAVATRVTVGFDDDTDNDSGAAALTRDLDGRRVSVADAYLEPARPRPNLRVLTNVTVTRVIIEGGRAVALELSSGEFLDADEVIISAGAVHTPLLLGRSGVDAPGVGLGIQDHPAVTFTLRLREPPRPGGLAMGAVARLASTPGGAADLQLLAMNHVGDGVHGAVVLALLDVHSRGRVTAGSDGRPAVHMGQLSDGRDLAALAAGVVSTVRVLRSGGFDRVAEAVFIDDRGTPLDDLGDTTDEIAAWLSSHAGGLYHAGSSCRMGPLGADHTVLDGRLRVVGVENLRVCDASVFPRLPCANVHLPVVLVAERAAEMLAVDLAP